jgi:Tetracyclin repressor-like, C-terminal domain
VLNRGIARGELRQDIDQHMVTDLLLGPFSVRTLVMQSASPPLELVPQIVGGVFDGIRRG